MSDELNHLIESLHLAPHPEGGFFLETYRSPLTLNELLQFEGKRSCSTAIYYLLTSETRSHLHQIKSDEVWHFYKGSSLVIHMLSHEGVYSKKTLGPNLAEGESFQFVVPAGVWFGAEVVKGGDYCLVGCTVSPGFDFSDFKLANRSEMLSLYPQHAEFLEEFCLESSETSEIS